MYKLVIFQDLDRSFPTEDDTQILFYYSKSNALERFKNEYHAILEHYNQENSDGKVNIETEGDYCHIYDNSSSWTASITEVETEDAIEDADNDNCIACIKWSKEDIITALTDLGISATEKNIDKILYSNDFDFTSVIQDRSIEEGWEIIKAIINGIDDFELEGTKEPIDEDYYSKQFQLLRVSKLDPTIRAKKINALVKEINEKVENYDYDNSIYCDSNDTLNYLIDRINEDEYQNSIVQKQKGFLELRICNDCGKLMAEGYCMNDGDEYYCSDKCLEKNTTEEEREEIQDENSTSYWTEWY